MKANQESDDQFSWFMQDNIISLNPIAYIISAVFFPFSLSNLSHSKGRRRKKEKKMQGLIKDLIDITIGNINNNNRNNEEEEDDRNNREERNRSTWAQVSTNPSTPISFNSVI